MTGKVFISYSRKDQSQVEAIAEALELNKHRVFLDVAQIAPGENWVEAIREAISESDTFVFVISKNSVSSEYLLHELYTAIETGKRIIPIVVEDVDASRVPDSLRSMQWIDLRHGSGVFSDRLRSVLGTGSSDTAELSRRKSKGYVFLSYAQDDADFVRSLRSFLQEKGYAYWDYDESDRDYHNQLFLELEGVIKEAAAVFAIISEDWKKSKWTVREFFFAEESKLPVFLLRAKPVGPTLAIAGIPYIDFVEDYSRGLARLERELIRKGL